MTTVNPAVLLVAGAVFAVCAAALVLWTTRRAFSEPAWSGRIGAPGQALVDLREVFVVHPSEDGGVAALRGLTLSVERGELCVVLGPSGAGKSTLVRVVAGLERPSAGRAWSTGSTGSGAPGTSWRVIGRVVGYADQHYWRALSPDLSAEALVALPLGLRGVPGPERSRRARGSCSSGSTCSTAPTPAPGELSGGEQQRIALCAALAPSPALLVADEPTGELDEATRAARARSPRAALAREEGAAALVVSHDPASASIADRVVHVRDGRVGEERTGDEDTIVIGRGGWLHVLEESLRTAGIGERAIVRVRPGVVELHPAGDAAAAAVVHETPPTAAGVLVEARGVTRRFGHETALEGFDGVFPAGTLTAVTGPSGSGKSTLLALLAGLDTPDEGEIVVDGVVLSALDRDGRAAFRRDRIGVVGQMPGLSGVLTARENVELALTLREVDGLEARERAMDALAIVGLADPRSARWTASRQASGSAWRSRGRSPGVRPCSSRTSRPRASTASRPSPWPVSSPISRASTARR